MNRLNYSVFIVAACFLLFATPQINAQEMDNLSQYAEDQLDNAVEPVIKLFGNLAGGGFVNTADLHGLAGFEVGVRGNITLVPDKYKDFGPLKGVDVVGLPLLQASVGLPGNLELTGRFFSMAVSDETDGNVTLVGALVKYGLFQQPLLPKISVVAGYHALITPDKYDFGTFNVISLKGYVSHNFLIFTLYGGGGIDRASSTIKFTEVNTQTDFEKSYAQTGANGSVGLTISPIPFFKANADYSFGSFNRVSLGLSFSFR
ncbi:MAG: hypothetical protein H6696_19665 [Deferribacteres bacterium]|nr:hypothetical protein [candidate division KSB1 bacterium]MCB9504147.1 hypothetical protein [Deferribacteres bacterium]